MTLNASLNIARQAITNNQFGLNVISNNIANMNTIGYSRQSAAYSSRAGYTTYNYASGNRYILGDGAQLDTVMRNRDQFLDNHYRQQAADTGYYTQIGSMTSVIETTMNELGEKGLQKALNDFYAATDSLAGDPSNDGYRIAYASALENVASQFNQMSSSLKTAIRENVGELGDPASFAGSKVNTTVNDLNSKLAQLADLNQQVLQNSTTAGTANELMDKRDILLDEISAIIPIDITTNSNNTVNVSFDNRTLVDGNKQYIQFKAVQGADEDKPAVIQLANMDDPPVIIKKDITDKVDSGILGAILSTAGANTVDGVNYTTVLNQLDQMAKAFADKLNEIQTQVKDGKTPLSIDDNGELVQANEPLFTTSDGEDFNASNIRINQNIIDNPKNIAAARADITDPDFDPETVGNASNMDLILALKTEKLDSLASTPGGAAVSLNDYLTNVTSTVGNKLSSINNKAEAQQSVLNQIDTQRNSLFGVNLDEEITDLIKFQRSYEAAARVFNVTSQMMQILTQLGA